MGVLFKINNFLRLSFKTIRDSYRTLLNLSHLHIVIPQTVLTVRLLILKILQVYSSFEVQNKK